MQRLEIFGLLYISESGPTGPGSNQHVISELAVIVRKTEGGYARAFKTHGQSKVLTTSILQMSSVKTEKILAAKLSRLSRCKKSFVWILTFLIYFFTFRNRWGKKSLKPHLWMRATIAQCLSFCLPSCGLGFES